MAGAPGAERVSASEQVQARCGGFAVRLVVGVGIGGR